jgi:hypothetical protein
MRLRLNNLLYEQAINASFLLGDFLSAGICEQHHGE